MKRSLLILAAAGAALAAAGVLNFSLAAQASIRPYEVQHIPNGRFARLAALGQRGFVSDLYWLEAVQYIGDPKADERGWEKLYPLVDLVTDLDPRHGYAYQSAGIVLSAAGRLDESDRILQKGIDHGPPYWTFPYYIAFNNWFYRGDLATAARYAELAARQPGASPNISHLATALASKSGKPDDVIPLLRDLLAEAKDPVTVERLGEQLKLAILERDAQALEHAVAELERRTGLPVQSLDALVWSGLVPRLPEDPFGGRYVYDPEKREVRSSANDFRFRLREPLARPGFYYKQKPRQPGEEAPR